MAYVSERSSKWQANAYIYLQSLDNHNMNIGVTLYHTVAVVMLNIRNQYRALSTICTELLLVTYLSSILLASLSLDL